MADLVAFNDDGERDDSIFRRAWVRYDACLTCIEATEY